MGMFDYIVFKYPLPIPEFQARSFQTKDTPSQFLDYYEVSETGALLHREYDIEDRSDPKAEGLLKLKGSMTRVNQRMVPVDMTDYVTFYTFTDESRSRGWIMFRAHFVKGQLQPPIEVLEHTPHKP